MPRRAVAVRAPRLDLCPDFCAARTLFHILIRQFRSGWCHNKWQLVRGNLINSSICLSVSIHLHVASGTNDSAVSIPIHSSFILTLSCTADAAVDDKAYGWALSMVLDDSLHWEDPKGRFELFFSPFFKKNLNVIFVWQCNARRKQILQIIWQVNEIIPVRNIPQTQQSGAEPCTGTKTLNALRKEKFPSLWAVTP